MAAERVPRETLELDPFERAVAFAIERALERDRQLRERRRMTLVDGGKRRGGSAP